MRQFFKFMFASMLGSLLIGIVLIVLFVAALIGGLSSAGAGFAQPKTTIKDGSVLVLELSEPIVDRAPKDQLNIDFGPLQSDPELGLNNILEAIDKAGKDKRVKGIFLDLFSVSAGSAQLQEIREKLLAFQQETGKPVIAFADVYTQSSYYLASAASEVYLQPMGTLDFRGLRSEMAFFKGMFDKLDVEIQFIRGSNNQFKSFGEMYTQESMSEANRTQMRELLASLWNTYLTNVGETRKLDVQRLNALAEELQVRKPQHAVETGLVDGLKYRDEVMTVLKERMGLDAEKDLEQVGVRTYARAFVPQDEGNTGTTGKKDLLAVVYAEGDIMDGESQDGIVGSITLSEAIRTAREDSSVKAIVLRVNSPGGSGLASDVIWRELRLARDTKPVVVSMGNVAASGGYYIACAANKIFAQPNTVTGSIGVFGIIPNMQGFFRNKLGITFDGEQTNRFAGMLTSTRPLTPEEKTILQAYVDDFYENFTSRVAEGRGLSQAAVDSLGQGRVWSGEQALRNGLVDELGGLNEAIAAAAAMAGLQNYKQVEYPEQKDIFQQLMEDVVGQARAKWTEEILGDDAGTLSHLRTVAAAKRLSVLQARLPFDLVVY
jgi:protease IV